MSHYENGDLLCLYLLSNLPIIVTVPCSAWHLLGAIGIKLQPLNRPRWTFSKWNWIFPHCFDKILILPGFVTVTEHTWSVREILIRTSKEQIKGKKKRHERNIRRAEAEYKGEVKRIQEITVIKKCPESSASRFWENYLGSGIF